MNSILVIQHSDDCSPPDRSLFPPGKIALGRGGYWLAMFEGHQPLSGLDSAPMAAVRDSPSIKVTRAI
jgi:hypothetical protein